MQSIIRIVGPPGTVPKDPQTSQPYKDDVYEALQRFATETELTSLHLYPNFSFHHLTGPSGFTASVSIDRLFNADLFRCDLFRVVSCVKIKLSSAHWGPEQSTDVEMIRSCFPVESSNPPSIRGSSLAKDAWAPALGTRGTSIGIYTRSAVEGEDRFAEHFYIICHSSLPDSYLNELQETLQQIHEVNQQYLAEFRLRGTMTVKAGSEPVTYASLINPGGLLHQAREIALENNHRCIDVFAQMTGLSLISHVDSTNVPWLVPSEKDLGDLLVSKESAKQLEKALQIWPTNITVFPFSTLSEHPRAPPELRNYPIGAVLTHLSREKPNDVFLALQKQFQIDLQTNMRSFECLSRSIYNTYLPASNQELYFYSNCTPTGPDIPVYEGLELGFKIYNHHSKTQRDWHNNYLGGCPVVFPFKIQTRELPAEGIIKSFTATEGGFEHRNNPPAQFNGIFAGIQNLAAARSHLQLPENHESLLPLKVFLGPEIASISRFRTVNN